jgi:hypothetical protein
VNPRAGGPPRAACFLAAIIAGTAMTTGSTGAPVAGPAALMPVARMDGHVVVAWSQADPLVARTGEWCRDWLNARGFRAAAKGPGQNDPAAAARWLLEVLPDCSLARSCGIDVSKLAATRADSFLLAAFRTNGQSVVSIVGRNPGGLRSGVAALIARLTDIGDQLVLPATTEVVTPFFPIRELVVANRGSVLQGTPYSDTFWRRWSDDRIRAYVEELWLFGFNSLQVGEARSFRITPETERAAEDIARKIRVLADAAHANGMQVSQLVWGQAPFNRKICWNSPATRAVMENEFRWMARTYGPMVDHVIMHMRDPGGCHCGTCDDYRTPQEIAAFVLQEYRKINPKITVTLSTWFIRTFWSYAPGVKFLDDTHVQYWTGDPETRFTEPSAVRLLPGAPQTRFLDETCCPRAIGIALHKWYNADKARAVADSGRALDIWGWYLSDQETTTDMSLCMRRLDGYFRSLPFCAAEGVRRISTELCFHGWPQIINAYVSARKMWSPRRDLREIEREFCAGLFGETNADAMVQLYEACELVANPKRGDTCLPTLAAVLGHPKYDAQFRAALAAGRNIALDPARPPKFTTATPPQALLDYLLRHLALITTFSALQASVNAARDAGAPPAELERLAGRAEQEGRPFADELLYPALLKHLKDSLHAPP